MQWNEHPVLVFQIGIGIASFFTISLGGLVIGIIFGIFTALLTRTTRDLRGNIPRTLHSELQSSTKRISDNQCSQTCNKSWYLKQHQKNASVFLFILRNLDISKGDFTWCILCYSLEAILKQVHRIFSRSVLRTIWFVGCGVVWTILVLPLSSVWLCPDIAKCKKKSYVGYIGLYALEF